MREVDAGEGVRAEVFVAAGWMLTLVHCSRVHKDVCPQRVLPLSYCAWYHELSDAAF